MARLCGIPVPEHRLFPQENGRTWLAVKRFDCVDGIENGRKHMQTLCGLLDADYRQPSMDYEDLIKACQALCQSPAVGRSQFLRAMFNLFAANQCDLFLLCRTDSGHCRQNWRQYSFYCCSHAAAGGYLPYFSPICGAIVAAAGISGVSPLDVVKRTFPPMLVGLIVTTVASYLMF